MGIDFGDPVLWLGAGSVFILVLTVWFIGLALWYFFRAREKEKVETRLGLKSGPVESEGTRTIRLWRDDGETVETTIEGRFIRVTLGDRLSMLRNELGWDVSPVVLFLGILGLGILAGGVTYALTNNVMLSVLAFLGMISLPFMYLKRRLSQRQELFETQLADALALATRSLRAGHPLAGAFRLILEETEPPVSDVFAEVTQQQALGVSLEDAIRMAAARSPSEDMKLFAAAMTIQIRSGGNLADMMDRLAAVIRDRLKLYRRARVLTSQTQLSKRILIAVPILLLLGLWVLKPQYVEPMFTTFPGKVMLAIAAGCLIVGAWVMNKIAVVKY